MLEPDADELKITLKGNLAGMLSAARDSKRSLDTGDLMRHARSFSVRTLAQGVSPHRQGSTG